MNGNRGVGGGGYKANSPLDWIKRESRRVEETSRGWVLACLGDEWAEQHRLVTACMARSTAVAAATNPQLHRLVTACMARSTAVAAATNPQLHRLVTACMARSTAVAAATNPQLHRLVTASMARSTAVAAATNPVTSVGDCMHDQINGRGCSHESTVGLNKTVFIHRNHKFNK